ncbi:class I SAM-dependent methyltransferase [Parasulfuritortus cantonensis]|uniref:Class I SAM-dependent methyltransferase n=1 Tax=Parasulfuritortus cantonensis TaxID=2528202 RepID=A0A4R1B8Z0_9PROT|nr:class I SAM-dependent methyltransferase [Parasulfuritortus cantonensis]TCJ13465.1 class I SAM-dependent methyltransferase [Parasulfuritortus cantonensis]
MTPMPWLVRWAGMIPAGGRVLDLACGGGRHAVFLAGLGHRVEAVDVDLGPSAPCRDTPGVTWRQYDLEAGAWPFEAGVYQGIVVTNYLHRPLFPHLIDALAPGGVLIYATFSAGQQMYGRPRNPLHLLLPGELLEAVRGHMRVVAYEDVVDGGEVPARVQRLCAIKS